jgi:hypothetical protein
MCKSIEVKNDCVPYAWGSAANGQLGIVQNFVKEFENDNLNQFYLEENLCSALDEYNEFGTITDEISEE